MPVPVTIPKATLALEEAVILGWKKTVGSRVEKGEILFEMETDKVVIEVPAPVSGYLLRVEIAEGLARIEQPVAWIGDLGEVPDASLVAAHAEALVAGNRPSAPVLHAGGDSGPGDFGPGAPPATPAARRRARELGIDLTSLSGTGPGGRVTERDVEAAARRSVRQDA
jgi:pyruvate dehydrogenase E2 component (dihydrolipoamide acetyltransferase)